MVTADKKEEKKNERIGMIVSIAVHAVVLIVFLFLFAYTPPDPPLPGHPGVEIAFGFDNSGKGDNRNDVAVDNVQENTTEEVEPQPEPEVVEEVVETVDASVINTESPDVVETKEIKETSVKKTEEKKEPKKEETPKTETPTKEAVTKSTNSEGQGDDKEPGKKGNEKGSLDENAVYSGNPGDGGGGDGDGTRLDLGGWRMGFSIDKKDASNENGYIIYQVKVDEDGELISLIPTSQTVSPKVEKFYRDQVTSNWVIYRERGSKTAPASVGTLKVIVKSH
ncbi:MAG TPA: hypothetical protein VIK89_14445 [Cytophagaceae bacterium]